MIYNFVFEKLKSQIFIHVLENFIYFTNSINNLNKKIKYFFND